MDPAVQLFVMPIWPVRPDAPPVAGDLPVQAPQESVIDLPDAIPFGATFVQTSVSPL